MLAPGFAATFQIFIGSEATIKPMRMAALAVQMEI
jgi:hypothetical protein